MAPPSRSSGFTLFEVMAALLVISIGMLGLAGTLGPASELAGQGRLQARAAQLLESRLDRLRVELLRNAPACLPPAPGSLRHPEGILERWSARSSGGLIELFIEASAPGKRSSADTLLTWLPCP